ncbi:complement C1q-like protein 4 [Patella vulgata]|uniref:complement C1q-like protein 4 n=1 Tax=Patella vulgata TaxID=6465 RepID=UPI0021804115|nr:complement C1q-like protein 4 [Patella vulgata]XP_050405908.1 complement C1q-like protein 4 [Patella vulgata]
MMVKGDICILILVLLTVVESKRYPRRNRNKEKDEAQRDEGEPHCELEVACRGEKNIPITLPIRGAKGPQGKNGQKGEAGEPGSPGIPGREGRSAPPVLRVAFFVGLQKNQGPVTENTDLVFDRVITNVGKVFNQDTGRFTATHNGTYQFNVVVAAQGRQRAAVNLVRNGEMVATIWAESIPYWASASNSAILELKGGDQVWLVLLSRAPYIHGYMYSTFSGHLLFPAKE